MSLQTKDVNGQQTAFAVLAGSLAVPGDQFWMDWSRDGGARWIQCGPFSIRAYGQTGITYGKTTNTSPAVDYARLRTDGVQQRESVHRVVVRHTLSVAVRSIRRVHHLSRWRHR